MTNVKCQNCVILFNLQILYFYSASNTDDVIDIVKHIVKNELEKRDLWFRVNDIK